MKIFEMSTIKKKLLFGFILYIALFVVLGIITILGHVKIKQEVGENTELTINGILSVNRVKTLLSRIREETYSYQNLWQMTFMSHQNDSLVARLLDEAEDFNENLDDLFFVQSKLEQDLKKSYESEVIEKINKRIEHTSKVCFQIFHFLESNDCEHGIVALNDELEEMEESSIMFLDSLLSLSFNKLDQQERSSIETFNNIMNISWVAVAVSLIISAFFYFRVRQDITRPLENFKNSVSQISSSDSNVKIDESYYNEIGVLAKSFNLMLERLEKGRLRLLNEIFIREKTEIALKDSEKRFRFLVQKSSDIIILIKENGKITYTSESITGVLGLTTEGLLKSSIYNFIDERDHNSLRKLLQNLLPSQSRPITLRGIDKDSDKIWLEAVCTNMLSESSVNAIVLNIRDINKQKLFEEGLKKSEEKFSKSFNNSPTAITLSTIDGGVYYDVNNAFCEMFGFTKEQCIGKSTLDLNVWTEPKDRDFFIKELREKGIIENLEVKVNLKGGVKGYLLASAEILELYNKEFILSNFFDITREKLIEQNLKATEEKLYQIFNLTPAGTVISTIDEGIILDVNEAFCKIMEFTKDEVIGKSSLELGVWPNKEDRERLINELKEKGYAKNFELRLKSKNNKPRFILDSVGKINIDNKEFMLSSFFDITREKEIEKEFKTTQNLFSKAFNSSPAALAITEIDDGGFIDANESFCKLYGRTKEELLASNAIELNLWADLDERKKMIELLKENNGVSNYEFKIRNKKGEIRYGMVSGEIINIDDKFRLLTTTLDITERKLAVEKITMLAHTIRSIGECVTITDTNNNILFINDAFLKTYGYKEDELLGKHISFINNDYKKVDIILNDTFNGGWQGELINRNKDGNEFPIFLSTSVILDDEGTPIGLVGVSSDITERKKNEEKILSSLREKETLLQEIHHRVKNNLQIVSSLLNLQSKQIKNQQTLSVLNDARSRIKTMALIHEKLYRSADLNNIDFDVYIKELSSNLISTYNGASKKITTKIRAEKIFLNIDKAIPTGLILNELISNSVKHAFPGDKEGEISINMVKKTNDNLLLTVHDNGVGMMNEVKPPESPTLGMKLVSTLVNQIQGKIGYKKENGTKVEIEFPINKEK